MKVFYQSWGNSWTENTVNINFELSIYKASLKLLILKEIVAKSEVRLLQLIEHINPP